MTLAPLVAGTVPNSMRIRDFWQLYGEELDEDLPGSLATCNEISKELKVIYGCLTVACVKRLSYGKLNAIICRHNGNKHGWIDAIEGLLEHQFTKIGPNAPPSAAFALLLQNDVEQKPARLVERFTPGMKLGDHLVRTGQLSTIDPPFDKYGDDYVWETTNPSVEVLTSNDTRHISSETFKYMACVHKYVAGDKQIFDYLGINTRRRWPKPFGGQSWSKIYKNRFKHGRALSCSVRSALVVRPHSPPPFHMLSLPMLAEALRQHHNQCRRCRRGQRASDRAVFEAHLEL